MSPCSEHPRVITSPAGSSTQWPRVGRLPLLTGGWTLGAGGPGRGGEDMGAPRGLCRSPLGAGGTHGCCYLTPMCHQASCRSRNRMGSSMAESFNVHPAGSRRDPGELVAPMGARTLCRGCWCVCRFRAWSPLGHVLCHAPCVCHMVMRHAPWVVPCIRPCSHRAPCTGQ